MDLKVRKAKQMKNKALLLSAIVLSSCSVNTNSETGSSFLSSVEET